MSDALPFPQTYSEVLSTAEFRLVAACAYYFPNDWPVQRARVESALADKPDADVFKALVKRHRLPVLVNTVLGRVAKETEQDLSAFIESPSTIQRTQMRHLLLHAEFQKLRVLFDKERIPMLPLKGTLLSSKLYGDPCVRQVRDIDLMVTPEDLPRALNILIQAGYQSEALPSRGGVSFKLVRAAWWHIECRHPRSNTLVELHWRFERIRSAAYETLWRQWFMEHDAAQRDRYELLYLCLHGASHNWERLKWLGDLYILIRRMRDDEWPPLIALAERLHMETLLAQTLVLMRWLFEFSLSRPAYAFVSAYEARAIFAANAALSRIVESNENSNSGIIYSWKRLRAANQRYRRRDQLRYWLSILMLRQGDLLAMPLPEKLIWMYPFMRPFSAVARRLLGVNKSSPVHWH